MVARTLATTKVVIVTDNHVASLYAEKVKLSLEDAGFQVAVFDFLEGEERKNLTTVQKVYEFLVKQGLTRSDGIVALGGGVVGDLAGFVPLPDMRGDSFCSDSDQFDCPGGFFYRRKDGRQYSIC